MITNQKLSKALRSLSGTTPDPLACLGCGHEHNCKGVGCALLREAAKRLNDVPSEIDPETLPIVRELREKLSRYEKAEQEGQLY